MTERLDRLIDEIQKIQEPSLNGGTAPDVLVVRRSPSPSLTMSSTAANSLRDR